MSGKRQARSERQSRIWRVAFLLTADEAGATRVVMNVLHAQPDLARVDPANIDRLAVQHVREWRKAAHKPRRSPEPAAESATLAFHRRILTMPPQAAEAWLLARVLGLEGPELSRAMDCSNAATATHLAKAEAWLAEHVTPEELEAAIPAIGEAVLSAEPGVLILTARKARRKRRLTLLAAAVAVVAALTLALLIVFF